MKKKTNEENSFWISEKREISGQTRKPAVNEREFSDEKQIKKKIEKFYKTLFKDSVEIISTECTLFLETLPLPILKENEILLCQEELAEKNFYEAKISMAQKKSPENDGLTKVFLGRLKIYFITSLRVTKCKKEFTSSQKRTVIFIENLYSYLIHIFVYI